MFSGGLKRYNARSPGAQDLEGMNRNSTSKCTRALTTTAGVTNEGIQWGVLKKGSRRKEGLSEEDSEQVTCELRGQQLRS